MYLRHCMCCRKKHDKQMNGVCTLHEAGQQEHQDWFYSRHDWKWGMKENSHREIAIYMPFQLSVNLYFITMEQSWFTRFYVNNSVYVQWTYPFDSFCCCKTHFINAIKNIVLHQIIANLELANLFLLVWTLRANRF